MSPGASIVLALLAFAGATAQARKSQVSPGEPATVVFVCQHGNVKSLIASRWFNRLAAERGVAARAVSRGVTPETPVPAAIAEELRRDGFDVEGFEALVLSPADLDRASKVVMIGVEPPGWVGHERKQVETWDGIPPATESYEASRNALRGRIATLLAVLARQEP